MDNTLTLLEQATYAELAYYQQSKLFDVTPEDLRTWQPEQETYTTKSYARHVLERHGYSLHRYMARQLSPTAWDYWYAQGGIVAPFRS